MKKLLLNPWMAVVTLLLIVLARFWDPSFVESVRLRYFDQLITAQPTKKVPISVVNIDEATLDKYGQWPFPRDVYAELIDQLYQRGAGLVVFNVMMPEKDRFGQDAVLVELMGVRKVILPTLGHTRQKNESYVGNAVVVGADPAGRVVEYPGLIANVKEIENAAAGVGIVNTFPEIDGVSRRLPLVIYSNQRLYPSLALEALRVAAGDTGFQIKIGDQGVEALRIPKFGKIETDNLSRIWIDWSVRAQEYSMMELPASFNNGIVIVGVSVAGLINPIATAKGEVWPQDLQSSVLGTLISGTNIQRPVWADQAELAGIAILGLLVIFFAVWKRK